MRQKRIYAWKALLPRLSRGVLYALVAVGAGHLPMGEGLIELLRQAGYTVEPVK